MYAILVKLMRLTSENKQINILFYKLDNFIYEKFAKIILILI